MRRLPISNNGVTQTHYHTNDSEVVIETVQDVAPILNENKRNQHQGYNPKAHMRHAASVPLVVHQQWEKEFKVTGRPKKEWISFVKAKLNNPDNSLFRTWKGRI